MQREYHRHRNSQKFKKLKHKFKRMKRKNIKNFYFDFTTKLKKTNPSQWYRMAKQIGGINQSEDNNFTQISELNGLNDTQSAEKIGYFFAKTSNE